MPQCGVSSGFTLFAEDELFRILMVNTVFHVYKLVTIMIVCFIHSVPEYWIGLDDLINEASFLRSDGTTLDNDRWTPGGKISCFFFLCFSFVCFFKAAKRVTYYVSLHSLRSRTCWILFPPRIWFTSIQCLRAKQDLCFTWVYNLCR